MGANERHNVEQDMKLNLHESRLTTLESHVTDITQAVTELHTQVEITNTLLKEGFSTMKKLAGSIIAVISAVVGVTQI